MEEVSFKSAVELAGMIRNREISSTELTSHYIRRIERYDERINALPVRDFDRALEAARAADDALARNQIKGALHGLPMTIKESYDIEGLPTTWGLPEMRDNVAASDSETVRRLKSAGAHFMGKTNVPLNLADFQSYNDIYGVTGNPWDPERTPGGSSGGSAAALAAGLTGLEAGSDIGGSIRNPAHFCGVYGHKPTWGVVPPQGHGLPGMLAPPDIAVCGPLARSAEDLAVSMDIVAGADPTFSAGWKLKLPRPTRARLGDYRVAVMASHPLAPVATEVSERVQWLADKLAIAGAAVSDSARPDIDLPGCMETYQSLLWGVMGSGYPPEVRAAMQAELDGLEDRTSQRAQLLQSILLDHASWLRSSNQRFALREAWNRFFADWDILICPQMPTTAFPHDHSDFDSRQLQVDNEVQPYAQQLFWAGFITVGHLPSTVFPTGCSNDGLPIGLQAVGAEFQDYQTIDFARLLQQELGIGFAPPPGYS